MPRIARKPSGPTYVTVVDFIDHKWDTLSTGRPTYHGCTLANVDDVHGTLHGDQCKPYRGTTADVAARTLYPRLSTRLDRMYPRLGRGEVTLGQMALARLYR